MRDWCLSPDDEVKQRGERPKHIQGIEPCDYSHYASYVECYFTKPYVIPFDECGLPIQISAKIKKYISNDSIDSAIESLRNLETEKLQISSFEKRMIRYVQRNL